MTMRRCSRVAGCPIAGPYMVGDSHEKNRLAGQGLPSSVPRGGETGTSVTGMITVSVILAAQRKFGFRNSSKSLLAGSCDEARPLQSPPAAPRLYHSYLEVACLKQLKTSTVSSREASPKTVESAVWVPREWPFKVQNSSPMRPCLSLTCRYLAAPAILCRFMTMRVHGCPAIS